MTKLSIEYAGYALQLLLVLVLVVSLACKSWALLGVCLGAALVLFTIVCWQLLKKPGWKNVNLMKRDMSHYSQYPQYPQYPPYRAPHMHNNQSWEYGPAPMQMHTVQDMSPGHHVEVPFQNHAMPSSDPMYIAQANPITIDEKVAMYHMSHMDRAATSMQAPVRPFRSRHFVPESQGADAFPHNNPYRQRVAGSTDRAIPAHLDPFHPQNPMNSLSYLYKQ